MKVEDLNQIIRILSNEDIITEYEKINDYLVSDPHDEHSVMLQHLFQIEMSQRFINNYNGKKETREN